MLRISKGTNRIVSVVIGVKDAPDEYEPVAIDSFVIIPGVTQYDHIYSKGKWLVFDSVNSYLSVEFSNEGDLERFFVQLMRDIKINQITNVSVETKNS